MTTSDSAGNSTNARIELSSIENGRSQLKVRSVPQHVAIIMDGNHRWARQKRLPSAMGHKVGARNVRPIVETCADEGVECVTLFAFSTENWSRPPNEIALLMTLIRETLDRDLDALHERDARLHFIGDQSRFPRDVRCMMQDAVNRTANNTTLSLIIALGFGGRWELVQAAKRLAAAHANGQVDLESLDEDGFEQYLSMPEIPSPDLCIRTGGDQRLSNFLLWDLAYTELFFSPTYWPDFTSEELIDAIRDYTCRQRRFGSRESAQPAQAQI